MKIFLGTILTSVVFAQGRNLNTVSELQQKWALDENPSSNYTASDNKFVMTYATVADTIVGDANMQVAFYDKNCKNPVAIDGITPTMYPLTEGIGDIDTLKLGDGEGAKIEFVLDPETLANDSKIYSTLNGDGVMKLCVRFSLGYPDDGNFQEVNFVESVISITYDLTAGFDVANFGVAPKEQDVATGTLTYNVTAYLCEPGSEADGVAYPDASTATTTFNQGAVVEVCVRPDDAARGDGIVMDAITDFEWKRDDVSPSIVQDAIVGSEEATNGLTTYTCVSESEYCHFSSILFADFYKSTGTVGGSGTANLKFNDPNAAAVPDAACGCTNNGDGPYVKVPPSPVTEDFRKIVTNYIDHETGEDATSRQLYGNNMNCWDVSDVTNMFDAFIRRYSFNERLDCWNTSKVTKMQGMLHTATVFNQDLSEWDISSVTSMDYMFKSAVGFNQNLCDWNVDAVTKFNTMFLDSGCPNKNNPVTGSNVCRTCTSSRHLENDTNQENDHNDVNSNSNNKNNRNNENVAGPALQEDDNDTAAAAAGRTLKGDDEGRRNLQDDAIITNTATTAATATATTVASSSFDVSVGVIKADDGPGALKTAGGDASSVVGFTALASVVAVTSAAALLA